MGELARRRRARELWISRSHVWALAVGVVLVGVIGFSLGVVLVGGADDRSHAADAGASAPDESLVDLLARVDARSVAQDGVDTLTFPDTLSGVAQDPAVPSPLVPQTRPSTIAPGAVGRRPFDVVINASDEADAAGLAAALVGSGLHPRIDGSARVVVDGGADLHAARAIQARLAARLAELGSDAQTSLRAR